MTTKEQERKALAQIKKIIDGLGENSYVGTAFEGCFKVAEENIENDFACSMKQRAESAEKALHKSHSKVDELKEELKAAQQLIAQLNEKLDREQEWQDYETKENVSQKDYENLVKASDTRYLTDGEAKDLLYSWFGFAKEKTTILDSVPTYQVNRHGQLRRTGKVERKAAYNATDWNYIRFDCGAMTYELHNDTLSFFVH